MAKLKAKSPIVLSSEERIMTFFIAACVHVGRAVLNDRATTPVDGAVSFILEARAAGIIPEKGDLK